MNLLNWALRAASSLALACACAAAPAADYPAPKEGDCSAARFSLPHRRGDARTDAALHDHRRAHRRAGAGPARHRRLGREHADAGLRGRAVRRRASRSTRRSTSSSCPTPSAPASRRKPSDGLRAKFPRYNYDDMVRRAVPPGHRGARHQAPAPGDRQLDGRHADLDVGREVPGLHGRAGADGLPADRDVRPQLDDAPADHRRDPQRPRLEGRQLHGAAAQRAGRQRLLRHRHQRRRRRRYYKAAPTREKADKLLDAAPGGAVPRRRQRLPLPVGVVARLQPVAAASSASRPRCSRSTRPTTSATRPRPASWSAS